MTLGENEENIEWIVANKKKFNWHIFYIFVPILFVAIYFVIYYIPYPNPNFNIGLTLLIATICSSVFTAVCYLPTLYLFPHKIRFSDRKIFFKTRLGEVFFHELNKIDNIEIKGKNIIKIYWNFSKYPHQIYVDPEKREEIFTTFNKYINESHNKQ